LDVELNVKSRSQLPKYDMRHCTIPGCTGMQGLMILHKMVFKIWPGKRKLTDTC